MRPSDPLQSIAAALAPVLGPAGLLRDFAVPERNSRDWSGATACRPALVLRPSDTAQLAACLRACHELGQPLVVQGGLTGLCGGATPRPGEVALSLERMTHIEEIDAVGMTATVQAGVVLERLQDAASADGLCFPLDFGSRGSCTLGGNLACNAGGNSVIRYGVARDLCLGLEVVLADGTVLSQLNRMTKNTSGFDLKQMFIGSEGTLGVIARAVLRLYPQQRERATALVAASGFPQVLALLGRARAELGPRLCAFEVMWDNYLHEVRRRVPAVRMPLLTAAGSVPRFAVLIEIESQSGAEPAMTEFLDHALSAGDISDGVLAHSQTQAAEFWAVRDAIAQLLQLYPSSLAFDVSLPLTTMQAYSEQVAAALARDFPDVTALCFGHLGDGTLHYIIDAPIGADKQPFLDRVLNPLQQHGGAVSAEHGIGIAKRDYLALSRSDAEIAQMRQLKHWFDPRGILNPGRVFR